MNIETYEIEESVESVTGTTQEIDEKAIALIEDLELEGQKSLVVTVEDSNDEDIQRRIPYPEMSAHEIAVYEALFPQKTKVGSYAAGILPIRILQVITHARDLFREVEVWHKKMRDPDPILVGRLGETTYQDKKYLLARWSHDALRPFNELVEEARVALRQKLKSHAVSKKSECNAFLAGLEGNVERSLEGQWVSMP